MNRTTHKQSRRRPAPLGGVVTLCVLSLLLAGCGMFKPAKSTSHYYYLRSAGPMKGASATATNGTVYVVRLQPIELAEYLKPKGMAVRTGTNEIVFALFHRWAEPLDDGIRRVLEEDLRKSPLVRDVLTTQAPQMSSPTCTVFVRVLACHGVHAGGQASVEFTAAWELTEPNHFSEHGVFQMKPTNWNPQNYGELADRISQGVGELAGVLLEALAKHADNHPPP